MTKYTPVSAAKEKKEFVQPEAGTHFARVTRVIDYGTQEPKTPYSKDGKPNKPKQKISIGFSLPYETRQNEEGVEIPLMAFHRVNVTFGSDLSAFPPILDALMGAGYSESLKQADGSYIFNLGDMLGKACSVTLSKNVAGGKTYVNVDNVAGVPKGVTVPEVSTEMKLFDLDNFNQDVFDSLSDFEKETIMKSPEYKKLKGLAVDFKLSQEDLDWIAEINSKDEGKAKIEAWKKASKIESFDKFDEQSWNEFVEYIGEDAKF